MNLTGKRILATQADTFMGPVLCGYAPGGRPV